MEKLDGNCGNAHSKQSEAKNEMNDILYEVQKNLQFLINKEKGYVNKFKRHHKIIFAFVIFFAVNLLCYGTWGIVGGLPWLNKPVIAFVIGAIILIATGCFYENLISTSSNNNRRKEKGTKSRHDPNVINHPLNAIK